MTRGDRPVMMAEFASGPALLDGIRALRTCGVSRLDAFTPYEVTGLQELLGVRRSRLTWIALAAGLAFGGGAYLLQWWINVVDYPLNIGGRPYHSSPAFIPITFEMTVLFASAAALISALVLGGLPRLWHPVFDVPGFERASIDRFWLAVGAGDAAVDEHGEERRGDEHGDERRRDDPGDERRREDPGDSAGGARDSALRGITRARVTAALEAAGALRVVWLAPEPGPGGGR